METFDIVGPILDENWLSHLGSFLNILTNYTDTSMKRIMIIDNDQIVNENMALQLTGAGFNVTVVKGVKPGLEMIMSTPFDLIITEILLPEKDGIELLFALNKIETEIPVIAITAGGVIDPEYYLGLARLFGAYSAIKKPVNTEQLLSTIHLCLKEDKTRSF